MGRKKKAIRTFDQNELRIISLLQEDGRMPFVKIAEVLGITEGTVRRKVNSLIEDRVIKITAICDPFAIGLNGPVFIGINADQKQSERLAKQIAELPEVQFVAITTGTYEIIIQAVTTSNKHLFDFLLRIAALEGIKRTNTFLMLKIYKLTGNLGTIKEKEAVKQRKSK